MKKTLLIIVLAALCLNFTLLSQHHDKFLTIGDRVPDVTLTNIINSKIKHVKISDYRGKLIIIDFWSTWCSSCIKGFPELDSLQRKYEHKLQFFLVNPKKENDSEKGVKIVIDRVNEWSSRPLKLPIVLQDTALTKYFSFYSIPHCVWISPQGVILAITGKEQITKSNIEKFLGGEKLSLPLKDDKVD